MISEGRPPVSTLDLRLRTLSASSLLIVLFGIGPTSPTPGSRRATTRVLSLLQVMPTQDLQTGVVELQLSFRKCGTATAKSRRACLSELRSAKARGNRVTMMKKKTNM